MENYKITNFDVGGHMISIEKRSLLLSMGNVFMFDRICMLIVD